MKVYFTTRHGGAIGRVMQMLDRHLPTGMERVERAQEADLIVLHITGRCRRAYEIVEELGKPYAIIQYVLRSCANPGTGDWLELWKNAQVVWSYYDLPGKIAEDGFSPLQFNFYRAPLGVDTNIFYPEDLTKCYVVGTMGGQYQAEDIREPWRAAKKLGRQAVHIGLLGEPQAHVAQFQDVSDQVLRRIYSQCAYFSALRRHDGFEVCAAEALLCGAKPILYDRPDFRYWYDGLAEFVPEGKLTEVQERLEEILQKSPEVSGEAMDEAKQRFDWKRIVLGLFVPFI